MGWFLNLIYCIYGVKHWPIFIFGLGNGGFKKPFSIFRCKNHKSRDKIYLYHWVKLVTRKNYGSGGGGYPERLARRLSKIGGNPTLGHVYKPIVGFPSPWCRPYTGASGGPGCQHTKPAYSACSGRAEPDWTSSYRRSGKTPNPKKHPSWTTPPTYRSSRPKP